MKDILNKIYILEEDIEESSIQEGKKERVGSWITRFLFSVMGILALANVYFVNEIAQEIGLIIRSMTQMYVHFGHVSERMSAMEEIVADMSNDVKTMPIINDLMGEMNISVAHMKYNVNTMNQDVIGMENNVSTINNNVKNMSLLFRNVNQNMGIISVDVNQISRAVP